MTTVGRVLVLGLVIGALTITRANAALISIIPNYQEVAVGETVSADIVVSELVAGEDVGGVSLLLSFNDAILEGVDYQLHANAALDLSWGFDPLPAGPSGLTGSPLDLVFILDPEPVGDSFIAATVNFMALSVGLSPLNLSIHPDNGVFLSNSAGLQPIAAQAVNGSVCVGDPAVDCVVGVPEPGTLGLLGIGLALVAIRRRRPSV